jgi:hypothetical protein
MPKAKLIVKEKVEFQNGGIVDFKVWEAPKLEDKPHGYKYSFVYIRHAKGLSVMIMQKARGS